MTWAAEAAALAAPPPCSVRSSHPRSHRLPTQRPAQHARAEPPPPPTSTFTRAASRCAEAAAAWAAAAVGFTRRSLTRGRARGFFFFSHKAFFSFLFFFFPSSFAKLTFTPFYFSPVFQPLQAARAAALKFIFPPGQRL